MTFNKDLDRQYKKFRPRIVRSMELITDYFDRRNRYDLLFAKGLVTAADHDIFVYQMRAQDALSILGFSTDVADYPTAPDLVAKVKPFGYSIHQAIADKRDSVGTSYNPHGFPDVGTEYTDEQGRSYEALLISVRENPANFADLEILCTADPRLLNMGPKVLNFFLTDIPAPAPPEA